MLIDLIETQGLGQDSPILLIKSMPEYTNSSILRKLVPDCVKIQ